MHNKFESIFNIEWKDDATTNLLLEYLDSQAYKDINILTNGIRTIEKFYFSSIALTGGLFQTLDPLEVFICKQLRFITAKNDDQMKIFINNPNGFSFEKIATTMGKENRYEQVMNYNDSMMFNIFGDDKIDFYETFGLKVSFKQA